MRIRTRRTLLAFCLALIACAFAFPGAAHAEVGGFVHVTDAETAVTDGGGNTVGATYAWDNLYYGRENTLRLVKSEKIDVNAPLAFDFAFGGYPSNLTGENDNLFAGFALNELNLNGKQSPEWDTLGNLDRAENAGQYVGFSVVMIAQDQPNWISDGVVRIHTYANGAQQTHYAYVKAFREAIKSGGALRAEIVPDADNYYVSLFWYDAQNLRQKLTFTSDWSNYIDKITVPRSSISQTGAWSEGGYPALGLIYQSWLGSPVANPSMTLKNIVNAKLERMTLVDEAGNTSGLHAGQFRLTPQFVGVGGYVPTASETQATFRSNEESVATVAADGTVTVKGVGSCEITAVCALGSASYRLTVPVDQVTVELAQKTLRVGESFVLTAQTAPAGGTVTFASSDTSVATVDPDTGEVRALAEGSAAVTASCGEKSAVCTVQVQDLIASYTAAYEGSVRYGEELDLAKLTVTAVYDSGKTQPAAFEHVEGFDSRKQGEQTVRVSVGDASVECTVTVVDYAIGLTVSASGVQSPYGQPLDLAGLTVSVDYASGASGIAEPVTQEMISGFDPCTLGEQSVTVTKDGIADAFTVTVTDYDVALHLTYTGGTVELGKAIDPAGLSVTAVTASGAERTVAVTEEMLSGFESQTVGQKTVTLTVGELHSTFVVTVVDPSQSKPLPDQGCSGRGESAAASMLLLLAAGAMLWRLRK